MVLQRAHLRRRVRTAGFGFAAAAAVAAGVFWLPGVADSIRGDAGPANHRPSDPPGEVREAPTRPLTYGDGQTIHYGDRVLDTGLNFLSLDVSDDGVVFTTIDGRIWFTDGSVVDEIGRTDGASHVGTRYVGWGSAGRPEEWVVSDNTGSLLAWFGYPEPDTQDPEPDTREVVVYDSQEREVVARQPVELVADSWSFGPLFVRGDYVYWSERFDSNAGPDFDQADMIRLEVATGTLDTISAQAYQAAQQSGARVLVVGDSFESGTVTDGIGYDQGFAIADSRLVPTGAGADAMFFDPPTGEPLRFEAPSETGSVDRLYLFQWLDDHRFALVASAGPAGAPTGDLLVCSRADGSCGIAVRNAALSEPPLLPDFGGFGAQYALMRAMSEAKDEQS
ncbi:MAG: hypothetical protein H0U77_08295 [Nocardioidaceae bacterium]|nr:hypothetical protein [Nocardioidaceae bacterium]